VDAYYFSEAATNNELDLSWIRGRIVGAIEVQKALGITGNQRSARLNKAADLIDAKRQFLVSRTKENVGTEECIPVIWSGCWGIFQVRAAMGQAWAMHHFNPETGICDP